MAMPVMSEGGGDGGGRSGPAGGSWAGLAGGARDTLARLPCGLAWLGLGVRPRVRG